MSVMLLRQRKVIEGIETLRVRHNKKKVLDQYHRVDKTYRDVTDRCKHC